MNAPLPQDIARLGAADARLLERVMFHTAEGRARLVFVTDSGMSRNVSSTDYLAQKLPDRQIVGVYNGRALSVDIAEDLLVTRKLLKQPTR